MPINSLFFIFVFLPIALIVYHVVTDAAKDYVLLALSVVFYAVGSVKYTTLLILALIVTIGIGRIMMHLKKRKEEVTKPRAYVIFLWLCMLVGICFNLALLIYYKYADFALQTYSDLTHRSVHLLELALPLGISFYTFKAISYLVDVYRGEVDPSDGAVKDALYLSFFAQMVSGPLSRHGDMHVRRLSVDNFSAGVYRFLIGCSKKVLLADTLALIVNEVFATPLGDFSRGYAWLGSICFSLQLYYDFAGYSDMAIGITQMFGYRCPENFIYPYATPSVSKFWQRWHVTLGAWFRDYVYIPMGGSRVNRARLVINLFVVWLLTGIWHGAAWNFIAWGLGYFVLITFEKLSGLPGRLKHAPLKILYRVFALAFINAQWVFFRADSFSQGFGIIKCMFTGVPGEAAALRTQFLIRDYAPFLLVALILCTPIVPWMQGKIEASEDGTTGLSMGKGVLFLAGRVALVTVVLACFVWALSIGIAGQNNPFMYANF